MTSLRKLLVLTGDHQLADPTKFDGGYSADDLALHAAMIEAFESIGRFEVDACSDHARLVERLRLGADLVVNFCDTGFQNVATRELHIPALLELLELPYSGAPPSAMVIAYDKPLVALLAESLGVAVPRELTLLADAPLDDIDAGEVGYPALVKPAQGDGSVGINRRAVVRSRDELREQVAWLRGQCPGGAALVQEYLCGREFGLALVGNPGALFSLPMLEVDYSKLSPDVPPILAFESKTGPKNPYDDVAIVAAELPDETVDELAQRAGRLFSRIGFRDYARFDFRTGTDGEIKLMEVNPNPAWSRDAKLALMARLGGVSYPQLLELLVDVAWARARQRPLPARAAALSALRPLPTAHP